MFLWRACWHIGVANSRALLAAGIYDSSVNRWLLAGWQSISGGEVEVAEAEAGAAAGPSPTGIIKERACELVTAVLEPLRSDADRERYITEGLALCLRRGLTSVQTNDAR